MPITGHKDDFKRTVTPPAFDHRMRRGKWGTSVEVRVKGVEAKGWVGSAVTGERLVNAVIEQQRVFDIPQVNAIHGSVFVDPYYIGTPRGAIAAGHEDFNRIVRVHKDDLTTYDTIRLNDPRPGVNASFRNMEGVAYVPSRGKVYTIGYSDEFSLPNNPVVGYVIEITPDPFTAVLMAQVPVSGIGFVDALVADHNYIWYVENTKLWKFSFDTMQIVDSVSLAASVPSPHSMVLSQYDGLLYITSNLFAGNNNNARLSRFNPANIAAGALNTVQVPGTTDDSGESSEYFFGAIEMSNAAAYGYNFGVYAVRRSDFAFFSLPRLDATDVPGIFSYDAHVFDNRWLTVLKSNNKLYIIDLLANPPHTWSQASDVNQVVTRVVTFQSADLATWTDGSGVILNPSAIHRDGSGRYLSFGWPLTGNNLLKRSGVIRYTVPYWGPP